MKINLFGLDLQSSFNTGSVLKTDIIKMALKMCLRNQKVGCLVILIT